MDIVLIHRPKSIAQETSIDKGEYFQVYEFESDKNTTCINQTTKEAISSEEAMEGARYGKFDCRVSKQDGNGVPLEIKKNQSVFKQNNSLVIASSILAVGVIASAMVFGKD